MTSKCKILGISAFYHDAAAAIIENGYIKAAAQEERFTRKKHDASFPVNAIKYCIEFSNAELNSFDAIIFYEQPKLKFKRLLSTYYNFAPSGVKSFTRSMSSWLSGKLFLRNIIIKELKKIKPEFNNKNIFFSEHHLSHAASTFYPSPFSDAAIVTIDGVGEWATASICHGKDNTITKVKELHFPHSLGLLYSAFTYFLGFQVNSGEYKLMGLAPYGSANSKQTLDYIKTIQKELVDIKQDGSIWLNQKYFDYATGLKMIKTKKWEQLFNFSKREPEQSIEQFHCNLAYAIQKITEDCVIKIAKEAKKLTNAKNICLAGGVALNCVANGKLLKERVFENMFIQPAAGDAGGAIGAAYTAYHILLNKERIIKKGNDFMQGEYLGPEFTDEEINTTLEKHSAKFQRIENYGKLVDKISDLLKNGSVIGWFQGRMEFGPRALGNRSIIGDARNFEMQKKLNLKIKYRESFRPFAPSVLKEDLTDFFDLKTQSPYMLLVANVNQKHLLPLPGNYENLPIQKKLYTKRSEIQAVTHVDLSARIHSVAKEDNPRYWKLINKFKQKTGYGIIVNTSFNVRGEPIVCTPDDAYRCFMRTEMDYLVIGNYFLDKKEQSNWEETNNWKTEFPLD